jgi:nucleotide-binding universal stress UspA family protein
MKTILAAVDSSAISERVVAEAVALGGATDSRVVLLTVVQLPMVAPDYYAFVPANLTETSAVAEKMAGERLASLKARFTGTGRPIETVLLIGTPVSQILEQAKAWAADYIVMGSHGHTAFYDLLVGSTTHGVLLHASCPVLIVPPPKGKKQSKTQG